MSLNETEAVDGGQVVVRGVSSQHSRSFQRVAFNTRSELWLARDDYGNDPLTPSK